MKIGWLLLGLIVLAGVAQAEDLEAVMGSGLLMGQLYGEATALKELAQDTHDPDLISLYNEKIEAVNLFVAQHNQNIRQLFKDNIKAQIKLSLEPLSPL